MEPEVKTKVQQVLRTVFEPLEDADALQVRIDEVFYRLDAAGLDVVDKGD